MLLQRNGGSPLLYYSKRRPWNFLPFESYAFVPAQDLYYLTHPYVMIVSSCLCMTKKKQFLYIYDALYVQTLFFV